MPLASGRGRALSTSTHLRSSLDDSTVLVTGCGSALLVDGWVLMCELTYLPFLQSITLLHTLDGSGEKAFFILLLPSASQVYLWVSSHKQRVTALPLSGSLQGLITPFWICEAWPADMKESNQIFAEL